MDGNVTVVLSRPDGSERERFFAEKTAKPGVYRAEVVFPAGGEWRYAAIDPFGAEHAFTPIDLGAASETPAASNGSSLWAALGVALAAILLLAAFGAFALRQSVSPARG